ncbi:ParB-like nuclease domain family [Synechococcus sp. PCC 7335]|uniref:ParB/RepB/Spo0J family partition protein n=1 Tax=Synechococcus sp. (strain ATCC 29403 / PCC 7335) TaxID=91464 RepID=UPI00017ECB3C|nr:ParB/RepB/Spo0J family partition protein [Synechococcus sp. PCC 7335]EDX84755.1 ParB-like nuclease domain family [Synechococcus sp. PCC 7335]
MYRCTQAAQSMEPIPHLKEEIKSLKAQSASLEIRVDSIVSLQLPNNMQQPRLYFDPGKMELLKESIKKHGVLEPILLRPRQDGKYEVISGERRWRCCQALGMTTIQAVVRPMSDATALEAALIAHLLSDEISLIEQTESILGLLSLRLGLSNEVIKTSLYKLNNSYIRGTEYVGEFDNQQVAVIGEILGEFGMKLASFVSNRLPLLNLSPPILESVKAGRLSPTNAVLVNRQPEEFHVPLISQAEGKTKGDVISLIKATVKSREPPLDKSSLNTPTQQPTEQTKEQPIKQSVDASLPIEGTLHGASIAKQIYGRIQRLKDQVSLLEKPEVRERLTQIDGLIEEIESFRQQS